MEEKHLLNQIELLANIARSLQYSKDYSVTSLPATEILESATTITGLSRREHPFGVTISAPAELSILLTYNRNNISHLFSLPSLIARYIRTKRETSSPEITTFVEDLYPFIQAEFALRWSFKEVRVQCQKIVQLFEDFGLIEILNEVVITPTYGSKQFASLHELAEIVEPTLERFHIVNALLSAGENRSIQTLESDAAAIAQQLSTIYGINSPDFFERSLFSTYIKSLKSSNLVSIEDGSVTEGNGFLEFAAVTASTLDADVQHNVLQAMPTREDPATG
jgi:glycerol-3-phosphate O-acyltransferase